MSTLFDTFTTEKTTLLQYNLYFIYQTMSSIKYHIEPISAEMVISVKTLFWYIGSKHRSS